MPHTPRVSYNAALEPSTEDLGETTLAGHASGIKPETGADIATERLLASHKDETQLERAVRLARTGH